MGARCWGEKGLLIRCSLCVVISEGCKAGFAGRKQHGGGPPPAECYLAAGLLPVFEGLKVVNGSRCTGLFRESSFDKGQYPIFAMLVMLGDSLSFGVYKLLWDQSNTHALLSTD